MKPCVCNLAEFYDLTKEQVRPPCDEFSPCREHPYCDWCEHLKECHKEEE